MKKESYALHQVDHDFIDYLSFSAIDYSKFKFGSKDVARQFGHTLAEGFIKQFIEANGHQIDKQIVVMSSPYCFIPTATFAMKDYFVNTLNAWLVENHLPVVQETKIHRTITYKEDYGCLSADERFKLIGNDGFHIDREFVRGKLLIFLDDIKITGSHERVIERMCNEYGLDNECWFLYFAQLTNLSINPNIENLLNYRFVENLRDLDKIIKNENFLLNTRTVKYILNSNTADARPFLQYQKQKFLETLYNSAIGNSYHLIDEYKDNLFYIKELIGKNQHQLV